MNLTFTQGFFPLIYIFFGPWVVLFTSQQVKEMGFTSKAVSGKGGLAIAYIHNLTMC